MQILIFEVPSLSCADSKHTFIGLLGKTAVHKKTLKSTILKKSFTLQRMPLVPFISDSLQV